MNGVINIYKEKGYSSFHAVYMLRRLTKEQKVGHTGTLDPDVTGVLPVCIGKATKLVGQLTDSDKVYDCRMLFGRATDTQDVSGRTLREMPLSKAQEILACEERIRDVILSFTGEITQIPPMYSALKVNGAKLVNLARKGVEIERAPRRATIYSITDIVISDDLSGASFTVHCSRGTYVRTLCEDIGEKLGVPACMEELVRTKAAGLDLSTAITLKQAEAYADSGTLEEHLIATDRFLLQYPALEVTQEAVKRLIYGNYLQPEDIRRCDPPNESGIYRVYDREGLFYALYRYDPKGRCYKCVKMFY